MSLNQAQIDLLNNFYKSQPALNVPGLPSDIAGIALGDVLAALELKGTASTDATGYISVTNMTATGSVVVSPKVSLGADKMFDHVECSAGKIRIFVRTISTDVVAAASIGLAFSYCVVALA
jgi:hypothetical protein